MAQARELYRVYRELLTTILDRGRTAGVFAPQVRPTEDAALIMAALNGLLLQLLVEPGDTVRARELLVRLKSATRERLCAPFPPENVPTPLVAKARSPETLAQRAGR